MNRQNVEYDREIKRPLYAAAGIADYWLINLVDNVIEVYRDPVTLAGGTAGYRSVLVLSPGETITPLHFPECTLRVEDVIPGLEE